MKLVITTELKNENEIELIELDRLYKGQSVIFLGLMCNFYVIH